MTQERNDPAVDEVRAIRRKISARFGHDPARLIAHYMELQENHRGRLIDPPTAPEQGDVSASRTRDATNLPA